MSNALIILTLNEIDGVKNILPKIKREWVDEIIVVDGGSTDGTIEKAEEFGFKVIPVNPFAVGKKINGENVIEKLEDIKDKIDIVNVFRPSAETPAIAEQAVKVGTKTLWLQYGIDNEKAKEIALSKDISYIGNKCIKQEYQRLFLKVNPVFPVLK